MLLITCIFLSLLVQSKPSPFLSKLANLREYIEFPQVDYGADTILASVQTKSTCAYECDNLYGCNGYIQKDIINCYLKSVNTIPFSAPDRSAFYTVQPKREYTTLAGYTFDDFDIIYYLGAFSDCSKACDALPGCIGYIQNQLNGVNCWMKNQFDLTKKYANPERNMVVLLTHFPPPRPFIKLVETNYGIDGNYVDVLFSECPLICTMTLAKGKRCIAYTENTANKRGCWLHLTTAFAKIDLSTTSYVTPIAKARSYKKECGNMYDLQSMIHFKGSIGDCGIICDNTFKCLAFVYGDIDQGCWLSSRSQLNSKNSFPGYCTYYSG